MEEKLHITKDYQRLAHNRSCFVCKSPYQVIGAISIVQGLKIDADMFLLGTFGDYEKLTVSLRNYQLFRNVIPIDCKRFRHRSKIWLVYQMLHSKREVSSFLPDGVAYDFFYTSSMTHSKLILKHELERRNPDMQYVLFEDGLGSYSVSPSVFRRAKMRRILECLFHWKGFEAENTSLMVTNPSLLVLPKEIKNVKVKKMPTFSWKSQNLDMLLDIFSVSCDKFIGERVVLFDVTRGVYKNDLDVKLDRMDECYNIIVERFSYDNVINKPHPRSRSKSSINIKEYKFTGVPMEILYAGMSDLENRILIGTFSTALFTPKMMFDKEPVIICLYKIVWPSNTDIPCTFNNLSSIYRHKERLIVPETIEELKDHLNQIK